MKLLFAPVRIGYSAAENRCFVLRNGDIQVGSMPAEIADLMPGYVNLDDVDTVFYLYGKAPYGFGYGSMREINGKRGLLYYTEEDLVGLKAHYAADLLRCVPPAWMTKTDMNYTDIGENLPQPWPNVENVAAELSADELLRAPFSRAEAIVLDQVLQGRRVLIRTKPDDKAAAQRIIVRVLYALPRNMANQVSFVSNATTKAQVLSVDISCTILNNSAAPWLVGGDNDFYIYNCVQPPAAYQATTNLAKLLLEYQVTLRAINEAAKVKVDKAYCDIGRMADFNRVISYLCAKTICEDESKSIDRRVGDIRNFASTTDEADRGSIERLGWRILLEDYFNCSEAEDRKYMYGFLHDATAPADLAERMYRIAMGDKGFAYIKGLTELFENIQRIPETARAALRAVRGRVAVNTWFTPTYAKLKKHDPDEQLSFYRKYLKDNEAAWEALPIGGQQEATVDLADRIGGAILTVRESLGGAAQAAAYLFELANASADIPPFVSAIVHKEIVDLSRIAWYTDAYYRRDLVEMRKELKPYLKEIGEGAACDPAAVYAVGNTKIQATDRLEYLKDMVDLAGWTSKPAQLNARQIKALHDLLDAMLDKVFFSPAVYEKRTEQEWQFWKEQLPFHTRSADFYEERIAETFTQGKASGLRYVKFLSGLDLPQTAASGMAMIKKQVAEYMYFTPEGVQTTTPAQRAEYADYLKEVAPSVTAERLQTVTNGLDKKTAADVEYLFELQRLGAKLPQTMQALVAAELTKTAYRLWLTGEYFGMMQRYQSSEAMCKYLTALERYLKMSLSKDVLKWSIEKVYKDCGDNVKRRAYLDEIYGLLRRDVLSAAVKEDFLSLTDDLVKKVFFSKSFGHDRNNEYWLKYLALCREPAAFYVDAMTAVYFSEAGGLRYLRYFDSVVEKKRAELAGFAEIYKNVKAVILYQTLFDAAKYRRADEETLRYWATSVDRGNVRGDFCADVTAAQICEVFFAFDDSMVGDRYLGTLLRFKMPESRVAEARTRIAYRFYFDPAQYWGSKRDIRVKYASYLNKNVALAQSITPDRIQAMAEQCGDTVGRCKYLFELADLGRNLPEAIGEMVKKTLTNIAYKVWLTRAYYGLDSDADVVVRNRLGRYLQWPAEYCADYTVNADGIAAVFTAKDVDATKRKKYLSALRELSKEGALHVSLQKAFRSFVDSEVQAHLFTVKYYEVDNKDLEYWFGFLPLFRNMAIGEEGIYQTYFAKDNEGMRYINKWSEYERNKKLPEAYVAMLAQVKARIANTIFFDVTLLQNAYRANDGRLEYWQQYVGLGYTQNVGAVEYAHKHADEQPWCDYLEHIRVLRKDGKLQANVLELLSKWDCKNSYKTLFTDSYFLSMETERAAALKNVAEIRKPQNAQGRNPIEEVYNTAGDVKAKAAYLTMLLDVKDQLCDDLWKDLESVLKRTFKRTFFSEYFTTFYADMQAVFHHKKCPQIGLQSAERETELVKKVYENMPDTGKKIAYFNAMQDESAKALRACKGVEPALDSIAANYVLGKDYVDVTPALHDCLVARFGKSETASKYFKVDDMQMACQEIETQAIETNGGGAKCLAYLKHLAKVCEEAQLPALTEAVNKLHKTMAKDTFARIGEAKGWELDYFASYMTSEDADAILFGDRFFDVVGTTVIDEALKIWKRPKPKDSVIAEYANRLCDAIDAYMTRVQDTKKAKSKVFDGLRCLRSDAAAKGVLMDITEKLLYGRVTMTEITATAIAYYLESRQQQAAFLAFDTVHAEPVYKKVVLPQLCAILRNQPLPARTMTYRDQVCKNRECYAELIEFVFDTIKNVDIQRDNRHLDVLLDTIEAYECLTEKMKKVPEAQACAKKILAYIAIPLFKAQAWYNREMKGSPLSFGKIPRFRDYQRLSKFWSANITVLQPLVQEEAEKQKQVEAGSPAKTIPTQASPASPAQQAAKHALSDGNPPQQGQGQGDPSQRDIDRHGKAQPPTGGQAPRAQAPIETPPSAAIDADEAQKGHAQETEAPVMYAPTTPEAKDKTAAETEIPPLIEPNDSEWDRLSAKNGEKNVSNAAGDDDKQRKSKIDLSRSDKRNNKK